MVNMLHPIVAVGRACSGMREGIKGHERSPLSLVAPYRFDILERENDNCAKHETSMVRRLCGA